MSAGDSLVNAAYTYDFLDGQMFSTHDRDQDSADYNCAERYEGAWWFKACMFGHMNGKYPNGGPAPHAEGIVWKEWKGVRYSLKRTEMKIRLHC